jgi:hypothetical protein
MNAEFKADNDKKNSCVQCFFTLKCGGVDYRNITCDAHNAIHTKTNNGHSLLTYLAGKNLQHCREYST